MSIVDRNLDVDDLDTTITYAEWAAAPTAPTTTVTRPAPHVAAPTAEVDRSWRANAACAGEDPDLFHPEVGKGQNQLWGPARTLCEACPVREACLEWALTHNERLGMWGGLTPRERERLGRYCRPCDMCGRPAITRGGGKVRYCSDACRKAARRATVQRSDLNRRGRAA